MSNLSWQNNLHQTLLRLRTTEIDPRVALIGIGHTLCGDDGAGVLLARMLQPLADSYDELLVVCADSAPENFTGLLRRHRPSLVILVDAAQLDDAPGTIRCIPSQMTSGVSASTHTLPLHLLASYLESELKCEVVLLGIQPSHLGFGPISPVVQDSVLEMAQDLERTFRGSLSAASGIQQSTAEVSVRRLEQIRHWSRTIERERERTL